MNGTSYDVDKINDQSPSPIIRISNVTDPSAPYLRTSQDLGQQFWIRRGDLLVSWSASFKSTLWTGPEGYLNQHIFKVCEHGDFDRSYIRHAIEASFEEMQEKVVGIGMMHLRRSDFLSHRIPAPPLATQQAVASFLDHVEQDQRGPRPALPEDLAAEHRLVARIEELAGKIEEARALRNAAQEDAKALWEAAASARLARIAANAPERALSELVEVRGGGTPSKSDPFYWDGTTPWVTPKDMKRAAIGDTIDHISKRATMETAAKLIAPGAVLVVVRGMILARTVPSAVLMVPAAINQDMKALVPRAGVLPEFLSGVLRAHSPRLLALVERSSHDTRKLETANLLAAPIGIPPIALQRRIVADFAFLDERIRQMTSISTASAAAVDAFIPSILNRALEGQL